MEESLINGLSNSKKMSEEINRRVQLSIITETEIDGTRENYRRTMRLTYYRSNKNAA